MSWWRVKWTDVGSLWSRWSRWARRDNFSKTQTLKGRAGGGGLDSKDDFQDKDLLLRSMQSRLIACGCDLMRLSLCIDIKSTWSTCME